MPPLFRGDDNRRQRVGCKDFALGSAGSAQVAPDVTPRPLAAVLRLHHRANVVGVRVAVRGRRPPEHAQHAGTLNLNQVAYTVNGAGAGPTLVFNGPGSGFATSTTLTVGSNVALM